MQEMLNSLSAYGYIILFFYTLGGGMVAIIAAGLLSYAGKLDLTTCIVIAAISNFIGDSILFYLGRYNKQAILPYFKSHKRKLALAQILFKKYGDKIIFIKKYIYGLKTLVPLAIGLTKYSMKKFSIINAICSILWAVSLGLFSYLAGDLVSRLANYFGDSVFFFPVLMVVLLGIIWIYFSFATKKKEQNMRKIIYILLAVLTLCLIFQFYVCNYAKSMSNMILDSLKQNQNVVISNINQSNGIFSQNLSFDLDTKDLFLSSISKENNESLKINVNLKSSYFLFSILNGIDINGTVEVINPIDKKIISEIFGMNKPILISANTGLKSSNLDFKLQILPINFQDEYSRLISDKIIFDVSLNGNKISKISFFGDDIKFSQSGLFVQLLNLEYSISYPSEINFADFDKYGIFDNNSKLNLSKVLVNSGLIGFNIDDISIISNLKTNNGIFDSNLNLDIKSLDSSGLSLNNINLITSVSSIDMEACRYIIEAATNNSSISDIENKLLDIVKRDPKFDITNFSFESKDGDKFAFDFSFWFDNARNMIKPKDILNYSNFTGNLITTNRLSSVSPWLLMTKSYEDYLIENGILIESGNGYKADFELSKNKDDIIFNSLVPLNSVLR